MDTLIDLGYVSPGSTNKAKRQYGKLMNNKDFISEAKELQHQFIVLMSFMHKCYEIHHREKM